ncbi:hypothetical protein Slin15195_G096450 [Septoria linicola]|uniref:Uncharacterized protein n=1 Tax=Septoria linicola TaxID=215465 RepID=A0A9Q9EM07_9PEZI|nr:hypothetical protein Slin14017_G059540 [Septoria linicola]USW56326.1 hypothetical protein Slin15195_G096450 [Septoria linicola]
MCLVTPKKQVVVRGRDVPPRPVSNYHGGPRSSSRSVYHRTSVIPVERASHHSHHHEPRRSGERVVYRRTSRTYVR